MRLFASARKMLVRCRIASILKVQREGNLKLMEDETELFEAEEIIDRDNAIEEQEILSSLDIDPKDVRWLISAFRIPKDGGKDIGIFRLTNPRDLSNIMDRLQKHGTGDYRVIVYRNGKIFKKLIYPVEVLMEEKTTQSTSGNSDLALVLTAMREEQAATRALLERAMERPQQAISVADPMAMMRETLSMAASLAGLRQEPRENGLGVEAMLGLLTKGMELGQSAQTINEPKGIADLLFAALPTVLEKFATMQIPPTITQPQTPPSIPQQTQAQTVPPAQAYLVQIVQSLGEQAKQNIDVAHVAPWLEGNIPPAMLDELLHDPLSLDKLSTAFPVIRDHRGWFTALFNELRREVPEGGNDGNSPTPNT